jgi:hypothetical protein
LKETKDRKYTPFALVVRARYEEKIFDADNKRKRPENE